MLKARVLNYNCFPLVVVNLYPQQKAIELKLFSLLRLPTATIAGAPSLRFTLKPLSR